MTVYSPLVIPFFFFHDSASSACSLNISVLESSVVLPFLLVIFPISCWCQNLPLQLTFLTQLQTVPLGSPQMPRAEYVVYSGIHHSLRTTQSLHIFILLNGIISHLATCTRNLRVSLFLLLSPHNSRKACFLNWPWICHCFLFVLPLYHLRPSSSLSCFVLGVLFFKRFIALHFIFY